LLQIRFSLEGLHQRVQSSQRLILIYVVVYGLVLAVFGVYLLNRNIVRPVRQLHQATTTVAGGDLTPVNVPSGPGEIHELAASFNKMVAALTASRTETEEHIASLEETNQALARARDDLVRSEKLATVGHLAAGMAHEIGNPLGAVIGYLNILKDDLVGDSHDLVERSLVETGRIDRLIRELLEYAAPIERRTESFCPIALLRETVDMLRHQGQFDGVKIDDQCDVETCLVNMDRDRLMQVWINLLLNAQDAMHGEGCIKLSSRYDEPMITISVLDDGDGISPDVAKRIFEPFFTTKAPGSGYGLGLAVCQRIIDESGGRIEVTSGAGMSSGHGTISTHSRGACFTVLLPCHPPEMS
ncbi:MAG: HAMP domain-containing histidine kinase, partial [Deltaproteobacteria bacterium]|nr:HAMP domain-containing histidine kinase [Deltaproteobacteria bacterium]